MADQLPTASESEGCLNGGGGSVADKNKLPDRSPMDMPPSSWDGNSLEGVNNARLGDGGRQQQPNRASSGNDDEATMRDLEAGGSPIEGLVPTCASKEQLVRALWMLSNASLFVGVNAGLHEPTAMGSLFARHQAIYYSIIVAILAAVPIEMATAIWLQRSDDRLFHTVAEVIQRVGVVLLLIVSALGGIELTVKV